MYTVVYTKAAAKHITLLKSANLDKRAKKLVDLVTENRSKTRRLMKSCRAI